MIYTVPLFFLTSSSPSSSSFSCFCAYLFQTGSDITCGTVLTSHWVAEESYLRRKKCVLSGYLRLLVRFDH